MVRLVICLVLLNVLPHGSARAGAPPAPVPRTGQTLCYDAAGDAVIDCAGTGQDGDDPTGVAWPDPRFVADGGRTVTDTLTGLSWTRDADPAGGPRTWQGALDFVKMLNARSHEGHDDWRLPDVNELESLVTKQPGLAAWLESQGFRHVRADDYWSSSTYASYTRCAWSVDMYAGIVGGRAKTERGFVWPVRTGRPGTSTVPRTGQAGCFDGAGAAIPCGGTGQDGERQSGAGWPTPRFARNTDGTLTDRLTGLVWSRDGRTPGPAACGPGARKTLRGALEHVGCLNANRYLDRSDWRLPNRNELASLVNRGQADGAAWLNAQGFADVQPGRYWSSTTYPYNAWNAWSVNLHDGAATSCAKGHGINVWPVRGGR